MAKKANKHPGMCRRKGRQGLWLRITLNGQDRIIRVDSVSQGDALRGRLKAEEREGKFFQKPKVVPFHDIAKDYQQSLDARRKRKGQLPRTGEVGKRIRPNRTAGLATWCKHGKCGNRRTIRKQGIPT